MLRNLHIRNLALIREVDVDFQEGLNILTGETGSGKSILIDSIGLALGGRVQRDLTRGSGLEFNGKEMPAVITDLIADRERADGTGLRSEGRGYCPCAEGA